jgi:methylglutaconyl-CoA hydratase
MLRVSVGRGIRVLPSATSLSSSYIRQARLYSAAANNPQAYLEPSNASVEGITFLTLNRPEAKNAISQQMLAELEEAVEKARFDK